MPSGSKRVASEEIIELDEPAYNNSSKKPMLTTTTTKTTTTEVKKIIIKSTADIPSKKSILSNMVKKKVVPAVSLISEVPKNNSIGGLALLGAYSDSENSE